MVATVAFIKQEFFSWFYAGQNFSFVLVCRADGHVDLITESH